MSCSEKDNKRIILGKCKSIEEAWLDEVPKLQLLQKSFSATDVVAVQVNMKSLVTIKNNHYSVPVEYIGQYVEAHINAENIVIMKHGKVLTDSLRSYSNGQIISKLNHYLSLLKTKPGALQGSIALDQARRTGAWSQILDNYWQELIKRIGKNEAAKQIIEILLWSKDQDFNQIEALIKKAIDINCYGFESLKTLLRQHNDDRSYELLDQNLLGQLTKYDRSKREITDYDALLNREAQ